MIQATELGVQPVRKLLIKYALPGIIAMTVSSLYNIVDSIFIGHGCGALALSGLTVAKPFMDICAAFGSFVGVGASSLLAIKLGAKDYEAASKTLGNVVILNGVLGALVMIVGLLWLRPILYAFGASDMTIEYAREYMEVILLGNILTHIYYGLNNMLRSAGHPRASMYATLVAVIVNVVLDPIFIFLLDMGVRGAAIATMISQLIACILQLILFCNPNEIIRFHRGIWRLDSTIVWPSLAIGLSPFLMNLAHCFVVIIVNNQLKHYGGDMALATFGIINRVIFVFAMVVMGLNQGMQPIVGYNYGAQQYRRMLRSFELTAIAATIVMSIVALLGLCIPDLVAKVFTHDMALIHATIEPMRILCCSMFIVGFQMVTGNLFTSINMPAKAILLSLTRQVFFLIPLATWLPSLFHSNPILGVWWSLPISDLVSAMLATLLLCIELKKFHREIKEQDAYSQIIPSLSEEM